MWPQEEKDMGVIARDQAHLSGKQLVWLIWARSLDCCWLGLSLQETARSLLLLFSGSGSLAWPSYCPGRVAR